MTLNFKNCEKTDSVTGDSAEILNLDRARYNMCVALLHQHGMPFLSGLSYRMTNLKM